MLYELQRQNILSQVVVCLENARDYCDRLWGIFLFLRLCDYQLLNLFLVKI